MIHLVVFENNMKAVHYYSKLKLVERRLLTIYKFYVNITKLPSGQISCSHGVADKVEGEESDNCDHETPSSTKGSKSVALHNHSMPQQGQANSYIRLQINDYKL
jgi:hypothetical protein